MHPLDLALAEWLAEEEKARQKAVLLARHFYDGIHETKLAPRLAQFLNVDASHEFNLNVSRQVVDSVTERLILNGVGSTEPPTDAARNPLPTPLAAWGDDLFDKTRCHILQSPLHVGAVRDAEYFNIVSWDAALARPAFSIHQRYTDPDVGGDGFGCIAHYPDDDPNQPPAAVSKRWTERLDKSKTRRRMTIYWPDRIEKYQHNGADWVEIRDPGDTSWPLPWRDRQGQPLGVTAITFVANPDLRPEAWDAIPPQRAINKLGLDLLAAGDVAGFGILVALGWIPTSDGQPLKADGSNAAVIRPGNIIGTTRTRSEAGLESVNAGDLGQIIEAIQSFIGWMAITTNTPESRVSFTRQIAAEGTLKEQNEGLFAKVRKRQALLNEGWVQSFDMARRLQNTFGSEQVPEEPEFLMRWEPVQSRDTQDERDEWQVKRALGVPLETIWAEMGYTPEEIAAMRETQEHQARIGMMTMGLAAADGEETN